MFKNNAESSLFELLRDVFSKNFSKQHPLCLISHVHFLHQCGIIGFIIRLYGMRRP